MWSSLVVSRVPLGPQNMFVELRGGGQGLSGPPTLSTCLAVGDEHEEEVTGGQIFSWGLNYETQLQTEIQLGIPTRLNYKYSLQLLKTIETIGVNLARLVTR